MSRANVLATLDRLAHHLELRNDAEWRQAVDTLAAAVRGACWVEGGHNYCHCRLCMRADAGDECLTCGQRRETEKGGR